MTFLGIGAPDSQDQGSFTSGRELAEIDLLAIPAGGVDGTTLDAADITNLTFLFVNVEGAAQVVVTPETVTANAINLAQQSLTFTEPGGLVVAVPAFGGDIGVEVRNCDDHAINAQILPLTVFKSSVRTTVNVNYDDAVTGTAASSGGTVETFLAALWGVFDRVACVVIAPSGCGVAVAWDIAVDVGGWTIQTAVETVGTTGSDGVLTFDLPIRCDSGRVIVTNPSVLDPADVTIALHLSRTS